MERSRAEALCVSIFAKLVKHVELTRLRRTYPNDGQEEEVREGFNPDEPQPHQPEREHNLDAPFTLDEDEESGARNDEVRLESDEATQWQTRHLNDDREALPSPHYGSFREERSIWSTRDD